LPIGALLDDKFKVLDNLYNGVGGYVFMVSMLDEVQ